MAREIYVIEPRRDITHLTRPSKGSHKGIMVGGGACSCIGNPH